MSGLYLTIGSENLEQEAAKTIYYQSQIRPLTSEFTQWTPELEVYLSKQGVNEKEIEALGNAFNDYTKRESANTANFAFTVERTSSNNVLFKVNKPNTYPRKGGVSPGDSYSEWFSVYNKDGKLINKRRIDYDPDKEFERWSYKYSKKEDGIHFDGPGAEREFWRGIIEE